MALLEASISPLFRFMTFATIASAAHIGTRGFVGAPTLGSPFCTAWLTSSNNCCGLIASEIEPAI